MTEQHENREQLEQAIAALQAQRAALGDQVVDPLIAAAREKLAGLAPSAQPPEEGEAGGRRRFMTVLSVQVAGLAAASKTMTDKDVQDARAALWDELDQIAIEYGGVMARRVDDETMIFWGAYTPRRDDPERAIRAALKLQESVHAFASGAYGRLPIRLRVGISTDLASLNQEGEPVGEAVEAARRLRQATPPGGILVAHDTYRHVRGIFDMQPLGVIPLGEEADSVEVYLVERAKPRPFHVGTRGVEGIETCMIGREADLQRLQKGIYTTLDGERQMVTIIGEPGVGKSRLLYEFENWIDLRPERILYFKGRASQEMQSLPYGVLRNMLALRFQIQDGDPLDVVRQKMEVGVAESRMPVPFERRDAKSPPPTIDDEVRQRAHLIGQLLGFDFSDSPHVQAVWGNPARFYEPALLYLSEFFQSATAAMPAIVLVEDAHWADDSSLYAIEHLARVTHNHRLLILCLARRTIFDRRPDWGAREAYHLRMELKPLSRRDSRLLVEEILQKVERVPQALRELVVGEAEGNPFYVEELIKLLIEEGVIVKGAPHWRVDPDRLTVVRVPSSLEAVLQARLAHLLAAERTVLQQASVLGRTFWDSIVAWINQSAGEGAESVEEPFEALAALQAREIVFQRESSSLVGAREYIFKHTMLREVAYRGVLERVPERYHGLVAEWLIEKSGERIGEVTGLIASHLELAGQVEQARAYLRQAGEQAAARFAHAEAAHYFSRALDLEPEADHAGRYALLLAREKTYERLGEREAQAQDLAALEKLAEALDDEQRRAEVALRQARYIEGAGE